MLEDTNSLDAAHIIFVVRRNNFNISVTNLATDGDLTIPNPITTFEQAYEHYRKYNISSKLSTTLRFTRE